MKGKYLLFLLWISLCCHPVYAFNGTTKPTITPNVSSLTRPIQDSLILEPMYNLYYLSKVLARKQDNLKALGYLNHLFEKSKYTEEDKAYLMSFVDTAFVKKDLRNRFRLYFLELKGGFDAAGKTRQEFDLTAVMKVNDDLVTKLLFINRLHYALRSIPVRSAFNTAIDQLNSVITIDSLKVSGMDSVNNRSIDRLLNASTEMSINTSLIYSELIRLIEEINIKFPDKIKHSDNIKFPEKIKYSVVLDSLNVIKNSESDYARVISHLINLKDDQDKDIKALLDSSFKRIKLTYANTLGENLNNIIKSINDSIPINRQPKVQPNPLDQFKQFNSLKINLAEIKPSHLDPIEYYKKYFTDYLTIYRNVKIARDSITELIINQYISNSGKAVNNKEKILTKETQIGQQQVLMAQVVVEKEQQRASGFKLPSESDVIMALAQFMANRAKQETMIWFAATLKDRMQDQLIWDMFPSAKKIIDEYDPNSVPDFNEIWRTSLAKDFVGMPNNILNGGWIQQKAKKIGRENQLEDAKKVLLVYNQYNKYIAEKSNYSAVIENLYDLINQKEFVSNNNHLRTAINLIYIAANEFYTVHNNSLSYVDFNQIRELNSTEWDVLLRLIKVKYGNETYSNITEIIKFKNENIDDIYSLFRGPKDKNVLSESIISIIDKRKLLLTDEKREKVDLFINLIKEDTTKLAYGLFASESLKTIFSTKLRKTYIASDLTDLLAQKLTDYLVSKMPQDLKGLDTLANTLATDTSVTKLFKGYFTEGQNDKKYQSAKITEIISFGINNLSNGNIDTTMFSAIKAIKVENGEQIIKRFKEVYSTLYETPNSAKLGNILNALSRLQTLSKSANSDVSFSLVWNNMIDLLKFVDPDYDVIKDNFNASKYKEIGQLQNLHKLYVHLNKKEFKLAFKTAVELAEPFYSINDFSINLVQNEKGINVVVKGASSKKKKKKTNTASPALSFMIPNTKVLKFSNLVNSNVIIQFDSQMSSLKISEENKFEKSVFDSLLNTLKSSKMLKENGPVKKSYDSILFELKSFKEIKGGEFDQNKYDSLITKLESLKISEEIKFNKLAFDALKPVRKEVSIYNLEDLKNEFRKVRYGYKDTLVNLAAVQSILKDNAIISQFVNTLFKSTGTTQDYNRLVLSNLVVDVYTDPKAIFTKNFYQNYNLNELIQYSQLSDNSMNQFAKLSVAFADMMTARDDNDLYNVIENIAAPRESYRLKRINKHTFSLNGYVGAFAGYQDVFSVPSDFKSSFIYGITAPIGFTYSQKKWGVFVQGLELGNVVNHYLWNTTDKIDKQKLSFKEVFSPGISFMYNIPKSPFVAFAGCKLVQLDTRYDVSQDIYINSKYFDIVQYTMGVKVDIPFFTFGKSKF